MLHRNFLREAKIIDPIAIHINDLSYFIAPFEAAVGAYSFSQEKGHGQD